MIYDIPVTYQPRTTKAVLVSYIEQYSDITFDFIFKRQSTTEIDNTQIGLYEELEQIYNNCKEDGWEIEDDYPSKGVIKESYEQAKRFIAYINNNTPVPNMDAYFNGLIGFTWDSEKASVSLMFKTNSTFTYSIVNDSTKQFVAAKQTKETQNEFIKKLIEVL